MPLITKEVIETGIMLATPTIKIMVLNPDFGWGPRFVDYTVLHPEVIDLVQGRIGNAPHKWKKEWGEKGRFQRISYKKKYSSQRNTEFPQIRLRHYIPTFSQWEITSILGGMQRQRVDLL